MGVLTHDDEVIANCGRRWWNCREAAAAAATATAATATGGGAGRRAPGVSSIIVIRIPQKSSRQIACGSLASVVSRLGAFR
jgi:hypothetical protein